jgi:hypothetical protein
VTYLQVTRICAIPLVDLDQNRQQIMSRTIPCGSESSQLVDTAVATLDHTRVASLAHRQRQLADTSQMTLQGTIATVAAGAPTRLVLEEREKTADVYSLVKADRSVRPSPALTWPARLSPMSGASFAFDWSSE